MAVVYRVDGMTCKGCADAVTRAIQTEAPATAVTVDLQEGTVAVEGAAEAEAVARAVDAAGFDYVGPAA